MTDPFSDPVEVQTFGSLVKKSAFSFSKLKLHDQCPSKYKFIHIDKLPEPTGDAAQRGKIIHAELESAIKGELPLLSGEVQHLEESIQDWISFNAQAEMPFGVDKDWNDVGYDSKDAAFRGIIDLYYEAGDTAVILDFKTGKLRDYIDQLRAYATAIFAIKPHINRITPQIEFIDLKKRDTYTTIERAEFPAMKVDLGFKFMAIENDDIFAPNPGFLCRYCHFRKNNGGPCKW